MQKIRLILSIYLLGLTLSVLAATPAALYPFHSPKLRQRYNALTHQIRCLVCQNETIAASNAKLAGDLRKQVYILLQKGRSDKAIKAYCNTQAEHLKLDPAVIANRKTLEKIARGEKDFLDASNWRHSLIIKYLETIQ